MSNILITGGAGFIGCSLARKLSKDKNNNVTIIDNLLRGKMDQDLKKMLDEKNVTFIEGDLTDPRALLRLDGNYEYIYHLSAIIGVKNVMQNPDKTLSVNALSALNLFEYAKSLNSLKKIFFSSSSEVYAGTAKHFPVNIPTKEDVPLTIEDVSADRTAYALSKIYGESTAFIYSRKYGIPITIGRYHNIYGPRMGFSHVMPESFVKISKNNVIDVPSPNHTRAFCFVDDAVELSIRVCESPHATGEIVHIGNPKEEIKIKDLVTKIARIMERNITVEEFPDVPGSVARRCPDISKIQKLTGYTPLVSLEEGIRKTYQWYRDKL